MLDLRTCPLDDITALCDAEDKAYARQQALADMRVWQVGDRWLAMRVSDETYLASERSEALARECGIERYAIL